MSNPNKIVILYSGGLDSTLMYRYAQVTHPDAEVIAVYFAHGVDAEKHELDRLPSYVQVRRIDWLDDKIKPVANRKKTGFGPIYIPGRNMIFFNLAACIYLPDEVWMGALWDEDDPEATDKNKTFEQLASGTASYVLSPFIDNVKLRMPFVENEWCKKELVGWALQNGFTSEEILHTTSCYYTDGQRGCGKCVQCLKRHLVMFYNGIDDSDRYQIPFFSPEHQEMAQFFRDNPEKERGEILRMIKYYEEKTGTKI